jgi:hypothetical protein
MLERAENNQNSKGTARAFRGRLQTNKGSSLLEKRRSISIGGDYRVCQGYAELGIQSIPIASEKI